MSSKRNTSYAMTTKERVAHRRKLNRMRQKTWRDKRKNALSLVPFENLQLYKGHRLGTVVHSILEEKVKASKRKKKQYIKVKKNPRLHAEKMHKDSWRKRVKGSLQKKKCACFVRSGQKVRHREGGWPKKVLSAKL